MPIMVNGRALGVEHNGVFTAANTDPIPGGKLWPEAALTWNAMRAAAIRDGIEPWEFMPNGSVSSARPVSAQVYFFNHQPPPAAPIIRHADGTIEGTSNHGWGIAVDVKTRRAAAWLLRNAARFGWSHAEGLRVGEWWHFNYRGADRATLRRLRRKPDPFAGYTDSERRWIHEFDRGPNAARRVELRRVMRAQRKRIWRAARPRSEGGDGRGWTTLRRRRYASLLARTR